MRVIAYMRVSTDEQRESGGGIGAQRAAIEAEASRREWNVTWTADEGYSAKNLRRPAIAEALKALKDGEAEVLVVSKLDRLSRSIVDFGSILERARREGWSLVALDLGVDTTTPAGELVANVMAAVAQWERRAIGQRTKEALAAKRRAGVRLGRPPTLAIYVVHIIRDLAGTGLKAGAIAARLNEEGVPTAHGGRKWWPSTVRKVLRQPN